MTTAPPSTQQEDAGQAATAADRAGIPAVPGRRARWAGRLRDRGVRTDLAVITGYVLFSGWLFHGLVRAPHRRVLAFNPTDQALNEWFLAHGTRLWRGHVEFVTPMLNAPDGVNLLSNASLLAFAWLLAPITLAFGSPVTFMVVLVLNPAATAVAWYLLFARGLRLHRLAAAVGGAFAGFAPAMVSQSNSHLHITAQWLVPAIVWCVLRLARTGVDGLTGAARTRRVIGTGALLGAVIVAHVFVGEEVLFLAALALAVFTLAHGVLAPRRSWRMLGPLAAGLGVAAAISGAVLAYPLWVQFAGPLSVPNSPFGPWYFSSDLASFTAFSPLTIAGDESAEPLGRGHAEYNSFFGWPLVLVLVGVTVWLRRAVAFAAAFTVAVMCTLALGPRIYLFGERTDVRGPYAPLEGIPVLNGALPTRFALAAGPLICVLLALAVHESLARVRSRPLRWVVPVAVLAALAPLVPEPLPTTTRPAVPRFFTEGHWRRCVQPGGVLVPVPPPNPLKPDAMRWAAATNVEFTTPEGFFIGPYADEGQASIGRYPRFISHWFTHVARTGDTPPVTDKERNDLRNDVAFWGATCLVLADYQHNRDALQSTLTDLVGPGERIADVWVWRVGP